VVGRGILKRGVIDMEISGNILYGVMVGIGYNIVDKQIDVFLGLISITFKWNV
jgi:MFS superfamily sulfate permease-like transporter